MRRKVRVSSWSVRRKTRIRVLGELLILFVLVWILCLSAVRALRKIAVAQIEELTNTHIHAKSVDFNFDGLVSIEEISIRPDNNEKHDDTILKAESVFARFSLGSVMLFRPRLKEIRINDFVFNVQQDIDSGQWNTGSLKIKLGNGRGGNKPAILLENGKLLYSKISKGERKIVGQVPIDGRFGFDEETQDGYHFEITTATRPGFAGRSRLQGFWKPGKITVSGGLSSADIPSYEKVWMIYIMGCVLEYDAKSNYSARFIVQDMLLKDLEKADGVAGVSQSFLTKFAPFVSLQKFFDRFSPKGRVDIELRALGNLRHLNETELTGQLYCRDVSICDKRFPYLVEHLRGEIDFSENYVKFNNLAGKHEQIDIAIDGFVKNFGKNLHSEIRVTSPDMVLEKELYDALKPKHKKIWTNFSPTGTAAIDYRYSRKNQKNTYTLAMEMLDVEAVYRKFPYPLKHLSGRVLFDRDGVKFRDVVSRFDGRSIKVNGEVSPRKGQPTMYAIGIEGQRVALDSALVDALRANTGRSWSRFDTEGRIEIANLNGVVWSEPENGKECFRFCLNNPEVALDDSLYSMLSEGVQKTVSRFGPVGKVGVTVDLEKTAADTNTDYKIKIDCLGNSLNFDKFPYPLRDVRGSLTMTKGTVELEGITALTADDIRLTDARSIVEVDGQINLAEGSFERGWFKVLAKDLLFDERLRIALPEDLSDYYRNLSPMGRFDLDFEKISVLNGSVGKREVDFAGTIKFKGCDFKTLLPVTELEAALKTDGVYEVGAGLADFQAEIAADHVKVKGKSFRNLEAVIHYESDSDKWQMSEFVADLYDGKMTGDIEFWSAGEKKREYVLSTSFDRVDLEQFLADSNQGQNSENDYTSGKIRGALSVKGQLGNSDRRIGTCRFNITDMKVGRLSPLAKVMQVLKLTEPKDFAFSQMLVDSYIRRRRLYFDKFDLSGDSLAFNGSGEMDLQDQNISLSLTARGQRLATAEPSVLASLTEGLGQAMVRMEITGKAFDPQVTIPKLPVIKDTLELLGTKKNKK